jgi:hypothetical protein
MTVIDPALYEGAYTDVTDPGYYLIQLRGPSPRSAWPMVLKVPTLEVVGRKVVCNYEILSSALTDQTAQFLIRTVLLDEYCDHYYDDKVDEIELTNLRSNAKRLVPMK